jgi:2'-5' RNA ligase
MNRYFIAILPPGNISSYITKVKETIVKTYNSKAALSSPPHITLVPPFEIEEGKEEELTDLLTEFSKQQSPFPITLNGYGSFPPKVIFMDVEYQVKLENLYTSLNSYLLYNGVVQKMPGDFHAHITVAFKDLTENNFHAAWVEYSKKKPYFKWKCDDLSLLKYEDNHWTIKRNFIFGNYTCFGI